MNKKITMAIIVALLALNITQFLLYNFSYRLFTDAVPDEKTALTVAEAVLSAMYDVTGLDEKQFRVDYDKKSKCWIISDSLPGPEYVGGITIIRIRKRDGKVLSVSGSM